MVSKTRGTITAFQLLFFLSAFSSFTLIAHGLFLIVNGKTHTPLETHSLIILVGLSFAIISALIKTGEWKQV